MPSPPHRHPAAGQSSLEYVGVLAVVAAALAVAAPVAGVSGVGAEVARVVRTGVCIVGGDVCRTADAQAAGLSPCTLEERKRGGSLAVTLFSVRLAGGDELTIGRRSDGSFLVVRSEDDGAGVVAGLGFAAGPVRVGIDGGAGLRVVDATAWELPDEAGVRRFLAEKGSRDPRRWPPLWRSGSVGLATYGWAGLGAKARAEGGIGGALVGVEVAADTAAGVRLGRGTTTYFIRAESSGPQVSDAFGHTIGPQARGPVVAEYTRDANGPRELAFRVTSQDRSKKQAVETVARLDLRDPDNRAVAMRLLRLRAPWAGDAADSVREAIRRAAATGTVERSVYTVDDHSSDIALVGRLGVEIGIEAGKKNVVRRLVGASAWTHGSRERTREDCLP